MRFLKIENEEIKRVRNNFVYLFLIQGVNFVLPLLTLPYLVRVLSVEKFGLVMFSQAFVMFFNVIVEFGFNLTATREISINRDNKRVISEIFSSVYFIKSILILFSVLIMSLLIFFIERFHTDYIIYYLSFGIVIGQATFPVWFFQGVEKMKVVTIINVITKVIFTGLIFAFVREESDFLLVPVFNTIGFMVAGIIGIVIAFKSVEFIIPKRIFVIQIFMESYQIFISNISTLLFTHSNTLILGFLTNNATVGVFASIEKLIVAVKSGYITLYQAVYPWLAAKSKEMVISTIQKMLIPVLLLGVLIYLGILFFANYILIILYDNMNDTLDSSLVFRILGSVVVTSGISMLFNTLFIPVLKKYGLRMKIMIYSGLFNLIIIIPCTYIWNIYGTAMAIAATEVLLAILGFYYFVKIKDETVSNFTDNRTRLS